MPTLEALRKRIATTEDLRAIVRTMKSLSAVSIRQYENAAASLAVYSRTIELGLHVVLSRLPAPVALAETGAGRTAAVVFGSDHGLCGRFNEEVAGFAARTLTALDVPRDERSYLAVGMRAAGRLEALGEPVEESLPLPGSVGGLTATVRAVLVKIDAWRVARRVTRILIFHNLHTEAASATPQLAQLLPVDLAYFRELAERPWPTRVLPSFTMEPEALFASLMRQHFFISVFRAGAESMASEHATRLAAMQAAERNIDEHLDELNAEYRRVRQDSITEELLDVVAGFEALTSAERAASGRDPGLPEGAARRPRRP